MATFFVTNTADSGAGTLRQAIIDANLAVGADVIDFGNTSGTITLLSELSITDDLTIDGDINGDDKADVILSGGGTNRIFEITGGTTNLDSLDITDGYSSNNGGAIISSAGTTLTLTDSTVRDSISAYGSGGGILAGGTLFSTGSTISGNTSGFYGGGVSIGSNQTATFINATIDGNQGVHGGGIGTSAATLILQNSTITDNTATGTGGGINVHNLSNVTVENTVIALNTAVTVGTNDVGHTGGAAAGTVTAGNSFFGTTVAIDTNNGGNQNNAGDPLLAALADNGGPVATRLVQAGSTLLNAGDNGVVTTANDANGNTRVQNTTVDIGASEAAIPATLVVSTAVDENDGDFSAGDLSLREAVLLAGSGDTITFDAALAGQTLTLATEIALAQDINIDGDIDGDDKADITLDGTSGSRIFNISGAATNVDLLSLNFQNTSTTVIGGAIYGNGFATLDIADSTFSDISTTITGGALRIRGVGTTDITDSLFTNIHANSFGGAIYASNNHTLNVTNSTVHANTSNARGGGISVGNSTLNLFNSTITGNQADADGLSTTNGGGLEDFNSTINITNSVIAENTSGTAFTADDVAGNIYNAANSFLGTVETITAYGGGGAGATDNGVTGNPLLGALADNGGTVQTRAILGGSALIDAGDNALVPVGITQDANGNARIVSDIVDIGAVETGLVVDHLSDVDTVGANLAGDILDDGGLSLREAIAHAGAGDSITFAGGLAGTITLSQGELGIGVDLTIDGDNNGDDKADIIVSGNNVSRIFDIFGGTTNLDSLDITNGSTALNGGAIQSGAGTILNLTNSTVRDSSSGNVGGGIFSRGTLNVTSSTISGNAGGSFGGGVYLYINQSATFINSTIYNNTAPSSGGGILAGSGASLTITNSTISNNDATLGAGGGIRISSGTANVSNSVIALNSAATAGTEDLNNGGTLEAGNSFFGTNVTITTDNGGNQNNAGDPLLAALVDNGGTVQTMLAQAGSQLINGGDNTLIPVDASDLDNDGDSGEQLPVDANGNSRIDGAAVDIGASEAILPAGLVVSTVDDVNDGDFSFGNLSLREAVALASSGDTINFDGILLGGTITLTQGDLLIDKDLIINGDINDDDKADVTINGGGTDRIFTIKGGGADVDLLSLNLTNGYSTHGGAFRMYSGTTVDLVYSSVFGNNTSVSGGGIVNQGGTLNVVNSTIDNNQTMGTGGGLTAFTGTTTLVNTTIAQNTADGLGGGIRIASAASVDIFNSSIVGNHANTTSAKAISGGGIDNAGGGLSITNTVIAKNTSGTSFDADDVDGTIDTAANSFIGTTETITTNTATINGGGDPLLDMLADNGGPVQTIAAFEGSALIDAGDDALVPVGVTTDADGGARIVGTVDIGSTESTIALVVDTLVDEDDGDFSAGDLSLREALSLVSEGGTITFADGLSGTITLGGTELAITQDVTIDGDNNGDEKADITISGNDISRVFNISGAGTDVNLHSLTLTNGIDFDGGAISTDIGTSLYIANSTIANSNATYGGGIYSNGGLDVVNSTFSGNASTGFGGAVYQDFIDATFVNTTFDNNTAGIYGGAISSFTANLTIDNSTFTNNTSSNGGGAIFQFDHYAADTLTVHNSVFAFNTSTMGNADLHLYNGQSTVTVENSFFESDVSGVVDGTVNGYMNLAGDPLLAALADNGGSVQTRAIQDGSTLINAGDNALIPGGVTTDANGDARIALGTVDIGATEFQLVVTSASDTGLDNTIDGTLAADMADGGGLSLREAIGHAVAGDEISFAAALAGQTITLSGTELDITNDLTIDGDSDGDNKADITISGNGASRVFEVSGSATANLISLDLTTGNAVGGDGGAVIGRFGTTVNIIASTIRDSNAAYGGGASTYGTMNIVNSTISGNTANFGGGLYVNYADTLNVINSTVYGNTANNSGGGIGTSSNSILGVYNSTIAGNSAGYASGGGGLEANANAIVTINNSIVASNTANGVADDVEATIGTANNSFFGTTETITAGADNNNGGGNPLLGELLDNGGPVLTLSPLDGSPVIGTGSNGFIAFDTFDLDDDGDTGETLPFDARGGTRILDTTVDIGAVEQFEDEVIRGTDGVNNIVGGDGDDVLEGKGGADNIDGGGHGVNGDTVTYISSTGAVQVVLDGGPSTGNHAAGDVVTNVENIIGSNFGDTLTGNGNANFIDGGLGNDTLNGLGGNDILVGDFNQDTLNGGDDDDDLDGGAGNDIIDGGAGIDTGRYDSFGGAVIINLNLTTAQNTGAAGIETISNVENLIGGIGNDRFTGKVQVSVLEGGGGSDSLFGLGGDDILRGGEGNDNAQGGNGLDTLIGGNGRDTLVGGAGIDTINGDAGKDVIRGGDDEDIIDGGAGRDVLIGGDFTGGGFPGDGAADTFVFSEVSDSAFGGATRDIIRDFEQGLDIIDLSAIDAITGGSDDAFTFIGTSNFSGTAGELRAFSIGGNTDVRVDVDGDGTADMEIFLNGTIAMTTGDFVL